jgi:(S)-3,5-dihydroxyphenylglycine transaminase
MRLARDDLHPSISDPVSASMNFLNEVAGRFPDAISLAAGRPYEGFYRTEDIGRFLRSYVDHLRGRGLSADRIRTVLMQYGRTNGHINELVARTLATDENIHVPDGALAITAGCQEAMVIAIRGLCSRPTDVLLASSPCYVGITGAARLVDVEVVPVPEGPGGLDPTAVAEVARRLAAGGRRPRALYVAPNFSNPSGLCLSEATRRELLRVAEEADLILLEDDPYGLFGLDDEPRPTLKSLDTAQRVIYLGSFAKSCFPGARVGFLVADQIVVDAAGRTSLLAEELSAVKSMLTVNTSAIAQAVIGGMLVEAGCSLRAANKEKIEFYRSSLRSLLAALAREFPGPALGVRWRVPSGGFFVVVEVPMRADEALLEISAREYGVLWTPMSFFYPGGGGEHAIRLACSALDPDQIDEGVTRLARLVRAARTSAAAGRRPGPEPGATPPAPRSW